MSKTQHKQSLQDTNVLGEFTMQVSRPVKNDLIWQIYQPKHSAEYHSEHFSTETQLTLTEIIKFYSYSSL